MEKRADRSVCAFFSNKADENAIPLAKTRNRMKRFLKLHFTGVLGALCCVLIAGCSKPAAADYAVVPLPESIALYDGEGFTLDGNTSIVYEDPSFESPARFLAEYIGEATGFALALSGIARGEGEIVLALAGGYPSEGYSIAIDGAGVRIEASEPAGAFV